MICPKDGSACCDDLCHGAGCLQMDGYPMLSRCDVCGGLIDEEIPDCGTCTCDWEEDDHWDYCPDCNQDWVFCKCSLDYPRQEGAKS